MEVGMGPLLNWALFLGTAALTLWPGHLLHKRIKNKNLQNIISIVCWFIFLLALALEIKYEEVIIEYLLK